MSEHEHEWQLDVKGSFYYCTCGKADLSITGLMVQWNIAKKRIKALEGVVEAATTCLNYLMDNKSCEGENKWRHIGKLDKALSETEKGREK